VAGSAPHLWLGGHGSLYDQLGQGFSLVRFDKRIGTRPLEQAAVAKGVPLKVVDVAMDAGRDLYQRDLALIRPDTVVTCCKRIARDCWRR